MQIITILSTEVDEPKDNYSLPFSRNENNISFGYLSDLAKSFGIELFFAHPDSYESGCIKTGWIYEGKEWKRTGGQKVFAIWDRAKLEPERRAIIREDMKEYKFQVFNDPDLMLCFQDKMKNYECATDLLIPTRAVNGSRDAIIEEIEIIRSEVRHPDLDPGVIVCKPRYGYEGHGIFTIQGENYKPLSDIVNKPYVIQPFLETSHGIRELDIHCRSDIRYFIVNGVPVVAYARIAAANHFISGVKYGARIKEFDLKDAPDSFLKAISQLDSKISRFHPRFYSTDMGVGKTRIWIFENNGFPSLVWNPDDERDRKRKMYLQEIILQTLSAK